MKGGVNIAPGEETSQLVVLDHSHRVNVGLVHHIERLGERQIWSHSEAQGLHQVFCDDEVSQARVVEDVLDVAESDDADRLEL